VETQWGIPEDVDEKRTSVIGALQERDSDPIGFPSFRVMGKRRRQDSFVRNRKLLLLGNADDEMFHQTRFLFPRIVAPANVAH